MNAIAVLIMVDVKCCRSAMGCSNRSGRDVGALKMWSYALHKVLAKIGGAQQTENGQTQQDHDLLLLDVTRVVAIELDCSRFR